MRGYDSGGKASSTYHFPATKQLAQLVSMLWSVIYVANHDILHKHRLQTAKYKQQVNENAKQQGAQQKQVTWFWKTHPQRS
jgi:hypothetical protein